MAITPRQKEEQDFFKDASDLWENRMSGMERQIWEAEIKDKSEIEKGGRTRTKYSLFHKQLTIMVKDLKQAFIAYNKLTRSFAFSAPRPYPPKLRNRPFSLTLAEPQYIFGKGFALKAELEIPSIYCIYHILTNNPVDELRKFQHWQKLIDEIEARKKRGSFDGDVKFEYHLMTMLRGNLEIEGRKIYISKCPFTLPITPPPLDPANYELRFDKTKDVPTVKGATLVFETEFLIDKISEYRYKGKYISLDLTKVTAGKGYFECASGIAVYNLRCPRFSIPDVQRKFAIKPANEPSPPPPTTKKVNEDAIKEVKIRRIPPSDRSNRRDMQDGFE